MNIDYLKNILCSKGLKCNEYDIPDGKEYFFYIQSVNAGYFFFCKYNEVTDYIEYYPEYLNVYSGRSGYLSDLTFDTIEINSNQFIESYQKNLKSLKLVEINKKKLSIAGDFL